MKRLHLHLAVADLAASTRFYGALFGRAPTRSEPGYAKWQLDEPAVNFAISTARAATGLDHLGIQVDTRDELEAMTTAWRADSLQLKEPTRSTCCYAESVKSWLKDPQGVAWEAFVTEGSSSAFLDPSAEPRTPGAACCGP
ncbi:MAG: ArsI/CadI family heavy metal resistance metalloenzyme [Steroidobacteraceae bacterium]|jgi:catechol 2,3-dioxygenase-like lactoylglutathione lyase family enzyme